MPNLMASDSSVLIIGGKGLVGSAFSRYCETQGIRYTIITRENYSSLIGSECDILVNANGNSSKPLASREPLLDFDASVRSVRASLRDFRFRRYLHISSCDVYPDCTSPESTRESTALDPARQSPYGFHKHLAEQCVQHSAADWLIFRCGGFVGPGLKKNAIFDALRGGPLFLDPRSELQFLHTDAAARLAFEVASLGVSREIFNLCGNGTISISDVTRLLPNAIPVKEGSPTVRYDISISKLSSYVTVPSTRQAVLSFVQTAISQQGTSF